NVARNDEIQPGVCVFSVLSGRRGYFHHRGTEATESFVGRLRRVADFFSCISRGSRLDSQRGGIAGLSLCFRRESDRRFLTHEPWIAEQKRMQRTPRWRLSHTRESDASQRKSFKPARQRCSHRSSRNNYRQN